MNNFFDRKPHFLLSFLVFSSVLTGFSPVRSTNTGFISSQRISFSWNPDDALSLDPSSENYGWSTIKLFWSEYVYKNERNNLSFVLSYISSSLTDPSQLTIYLIDTGNTRLSGQEHSGSYISRTILNTEYSALNSTVWGGTKPFAFTTCENSDYGRTCLVALCLSLFEHPRVF